MSYDDLPLIQCHPTPSDAELEAERDRKHARAVAEYNSRMLSPVDDWYWPVSEVQG
jgi:hypothetical protein